MHNIFGDYGKNTKKIEKIDIPKPENIDGEELKHIATLLTAIKIKEVE